MRPGRERPGVSRIDGRLQDAALRASMRPGREGPGIPATLLNPATSSICFNEARAKILASQPHAEVETSIRRTHDIKQLSRSFQGRERCRHFPRYQSTRCGKAGYITLSNHQCPP